MRPSHAGDTTLHPGWRPAGAPIARPGRHLRLPRLRWRLLGLAVVVLAFTLALATTWLRSEWGPSAGPATHASGTAFLGTATCADWRGASVARRLTIVRTLGVAATQPDPESAGATMSDGAAYGLLQRICASSAANSTLLYESYNRAASFQSVRTGPAISRSF